MTSQGFYINDLPGLMLDGKELEYFGFCLVPESLGTPDLEELVGVVEHSLQNYVEALNLSPIHLIYMDIDGHGVGVCEGPISTPFYLTIDKDLVEGFRLGELLLRRVYSALGSRGVQERPIQETLTVYLALQKFLGFFQLGWSSLFHLHNPEDRTRIFREFIPHKIPFFGHKETLDQPIMTLKLGWKSYDQRLWFSEVRLEYRPFSLEDVLEQK